MAERICFLIAITLTLPWSGLLLIFAWAIIHSAFPLIPFFTVAAAINAFALYKIGNSITLGADKQSASHINN